MYKNHPMIFDFPNFDPVALWVGPLPIRWYALAYLAGFILGWRYCLHLAGLDSALRPQRDDVDDFLPWAVLGVILGGRLGYVLFYQFDVYMADPLAILKLWQGGMAFHGGALGVVAALIIYPLIKGFNPLRLADMVCAAVPIGLFFGRIANFINGELYGRVTDGSFGVIFPHAGPEPRHPSQLYESLLEGLVLFTVLFFMMRSSRIRNRPGVASGAFLAGYGISRFVVEYARQPDAHLGFVWAELSMGQILSIPMIIAGLGFVAFGVLRSPHE